MRSGTSKRLLVLLSTNLAGKLDILGENGHTLGMNSTQVAVRKQFNEVRLGRLLQCGNGRRLESKVRLDVLRQLTNKTLEGETTDQKLTSLLELANLAQSNSARPVPLLLLLDSTLNINSNSLLSCNRLSGCLAGGGLSSLSANRGLLDLGHFVVRDKCVRVFAE